MSFFHFFLNEKMNVAFISKKEPLKRFFKEKEQEDSFVSHVKREAEMERKWLQQPRQEGMLSINPRL